MIKIVLGLLAIFAIWYITRSLWRFFSPTRSVVDRAIQAQLHERGFDGAAKAHANTNEALDKFIEQPLRDTTAGRIAVFVLIGAAIVALVLLIPSL